MIIGLSGTQGTGKSTILQAAKAAGFMVEDVSLSRAAQKKLGWNNLSQAQESVNNMMELQASIASAMHQRDMKHFESNEIVLVERTPADVWAYTSIWCARNKVLVESDSWAQEYYNTLKLMTKAYSCIVVVPQAKEIPFVKDPHRADFESRDEVDSLIREFIREHGPKQYEIKGVSKEERAKEICSFLKNYEN